MLTASFSACGGSVAGKAMTFVSHDLGNSSAPELRTGYYVVTSAEELGDPTLRGSLTAAPDFTRVRLAVLAPEFTSGSMRLELLQVLQEESEYVVQYRIHVPKIGTGDMAYPTILVEIPNDGREIRFEEQQER